MIARIIDWSARNIMIVLIATFIAALQTLTAGDAQ
jgi:hypothetical protein